MSDSHGRFVWYELMTTDREAAKAFYGKVVGWGAKDAGMPGMIYLLLTAGDTQVGGLMDLPEEVRKAGVPPNWQGYVAVDDVDASAKQAERLGATVHVPPTDIPDVGRFSVLLDPQKAAIALFKCTNPAMEHPPNREGPGHFRWHELHAADWQKAFAFYSEMFGWQKAEAMDMGEMGTYQIFSQGGQQIGGMFNKPPMVPAPFWLYYAEVADIDAAVERVKARGGQILLEPMQVPGGVWIIQGKDPQGAVFALVGKRG